MKNVLFIETSTGFGGSGKYLLELLKRIDSIQFNPTVIFSGKGLNIKKIKELGIRCEHIDLSFPQIQQSALSYVYQLFWLVFLVTPKVFCIWGVIRKQKINVVYLNNEILSHIPCIIAAKMGGCKVICHNHGLRKLTTIERNFVKHIDWFICVSQASYESIRMNIGKKPATVVYNGLDMNDYCLEKIQIDPGINALKKSRRLVGIFGRIVEWKGHLTFIRAAAKIFEKFPDTVFVITGDDLSPQKFFLNQVKKEISNLKLNDHFIFTGWREKTSSVVYGLDVVVHPSILPEPFGLSVIEAMALGKAVVASSLGAIPEIIDDGQDGLLFNSKDADDLAEKIVQLISDDELRKSLGRRARLKVQNNFTIDRNVQEIQFLLEKVSTL